MVLRRFSSTVAVILAACASSPPPAGTPVDAPLPALPSPEPPQPEPAAALPETPAPAPVAPPPAPAPPASIWDFYRERYDADGDARITRAEYTRSDAGFLHLDANKDGVVSGEDFKRQWDTVPREGGRKGFVFGEGGPRFGTPAPGFRLATTGGEELDLAGYRGKKPVVLVFGSFTCGPYCASGGPLRELFEQYGETVQFLAVYIREAHPLDGILPDRHGRRWLVGTPERHLFVEDPITPGERLALARRCEQDLALGFPMLVDGLDDAVNTAYAAWPERLYVVDLDGTIAYQGGKGPDEFFPEELAKVLERCSESWAGGTPAGAAARLSAKERVKRTSTLTRIR